MDITGNVALLAGLSMAAERLVEIVRGILPIGLPSGQAGDSEKEAKRVAKIDILAIIAGVVTAVLAKFIGVLDFNWGEVVVFGVLAGAGSGFWNSILAYLLAIKNLKKAEALRARSG